MVKKSERRKLKKQNKKEARDLLQQVHLAEFCMSTTQEEVEVD